MLVLLDGVLKELRAEGWELEGHWLLVAGCGEQRVERLELKAGRVVQRDLGTVNCELNIELRTSNIKLYPVISNATLALS